MSETESKKISLPTKAIDRPSGDLLPARARRRLSAALTKIESESFPAILGRIRAGESQLEIAKALGVHTSTLNRYLNDPQRVNETRAAMTDSAESWLDRGWAELEAARGKDTATVQLARQFCQEASRRASIRNPRYSDRAAVELSGPDGGPVMASQPTITVYIPANGRENE